MRGLWGGGLILLLVGLAWGLPHAMAAPARNLTLPHVVRMTMAAYFSGASETPLRVSRRVPVPQSFQHPAGVFVTLSDHGKPRACWGTLHPQHADLVQETIYATWGALTKDYRYPPIRPTEWPTLRPQVTVIRQVVPITSVTQVNPLRHGLWVQASGRSGVILPGEARDAHYQLVQARLKAGIQPHQPYQLYRLEADVYR